MLAVFIFLFACPLVVETRHASTDLQVSSKRLMRSSEQEAETPWQQLVGNDSPKKAPPKEYVLFSWDAGGRWNGESNDLTAEVGFEFTPLMDFNVTALGRHVAGRYDQKGAGGRNLFAKTNVTLWYVLPKGMKLKEDKTLEDLKLESVWVGPDDKEECGGTYRFKYLEKPIPILAHQSYRLTQTSWKGMEDVWFDGIARDTDLWQYALTECMEVKEGVHSDHPYMYPEKIEHLHRRVGMLNLRLNSKHGCGITLPDNKEEAAKGELRESAR